LNPYDSLRRRERDSCVSCDGTGALGHGTIGHDIFPMVQLHTVQLLTVQLLIVQLHMEKCAPFNWTQKDTHYSVTYRSVTHCSVTHRSVTHYTFGHREIRIVNLDTFNYAEITGMKIYVLFI